MTKSKLVLVIFLVVGLCGCKQASGDERAKALMSEANGLMQQNTKLTEQWTNEYQKAFSTENRAKFPGNRDSLRAYADKIITILDESSILERRTAEKYEEAGALLTHDKNRRGVALIARALRQNLEINELLKSQMQLVSDQEIKDEKTLSEKIKSSWEQIHQKQRESGDQLTEGRRLLGI